MFPEDDSFKGGMDPSSEKASSKGGMSSNKKKRKSSESSAKHGYTLEQEMDARFDKSGRKRHGKARKQQDNEEHRMELGDGSQQTQTNDKGRKRERRIWSYEEEVALLDILEELVNKGQRCENGTFKSGAIGSAEKSLDAKFPGCGLRASPHIESKMKLWKSRCNIVSDMLAKSGFGWNGNKKCVEVDSDDVWDSYVKIHKEANGWRGKHFPMYEKLSNIYRKDRANGKGAEGPGENEDNVLDDSVSLGLDDLEISNSVNQATSKRTVTPTPQTPRRKRFKSGDSLVSGLNEIASTFITLVDKICERMDKVVDKLGHAKDFSDDQRRVAKELKEMGFSSIERINAAIHIMEKPQNVHLFWSLNREDKEAFVRLLLARESGSSM